MLINHLNFVEQTLKYDPINFLDFCTQLRGRMLNDSNMKHLPDLCFDNLAQQENFALCYFEGFHHSLRENSRIDLVTKMPGCHILTMKFLLDKKRVLLSLSNGLMLTLNLGTCAIENILVCKVACIDLIKVIDERYLICAGIDSHLRIWNLENDRQMQKINIHQYCILFMLCYKEFIFTFGYDKSVAKFNFMRKEKMVRVDLGKTATAAKLIKCSDTMMPVKIAVAFIDGEVALYDLELNVLFQVARQTNNEIIKLVQLSPVELICFQKEGQITVLNTLSLDEVR